MINPFKAVAKDVSTMFQNAKDSDCAPGPAVVGAVVVTPIVATTSFITALFTKK